jgi:hypothetical protein
MADAQKSRDVNARLAALAAGIALDVHAGRH